MKVTFNFSKPWYWQSKLKKILRYYGSPGNTNNCDLHCYGRLLITGICNVRWLTLLCIAALSWNKKKILIWSPNSAQLSPSQSRGKWRLNLNTNIFQKRVRNNNFLNTCPSRCVFKFPRLAFHSFHLWVLNSFKRKKKSQIVYEHALKYVEG